jgi:hypothetical protein
VAYRGYEQEDSEFLKYETLLAVRDQKLTSCTRLYRGILKLVHNASVHFWEYMLHDTL